VFLSTGFAACALAVLALGRIGRLLAGPLRGMAKYRIHSDGSSTMKLGLHRIVAASCLLAAGHIVTAAAADEVEDFYKGKTLSMVIGNEPGTGLDVFGRALARHIGRHIPGQPNVVVQNMQGASGITPANWLYNVAPKDGTVMMTFVHTVVFEPLMGNSAAKFDVGKFTWIGNMDEGIGICGVSKSSGIGKFDELLTREAVFGATGTTGPLGKYALAVKNLLGAKIKLVSGYQGSASVKLAMNRGEVDGICGLSMSSVTSQWRDEYETGAFRPILQLSGRPLPSLHGIAHVDDYAKSAADHQLFDLVFGVQALGRVFVSPPGMPPERRAALRDAFMATMGDPQFVADVAQLQIDVSPTTGADVEAFIARIAAASPSVIEQAKRASRHD
jgi:tripartite-type tricarboxylate transporter receptor subunit TctC